MEYRNPSPASSSSGSTSTECRRVSRHMVEEDGEGDMVVCTGKSCQSCTAGVIADCVAVCCCPCAVVNLAALAFFKVPVAMARKFLRGRRKKSRRKMLEAKRVEAGIGISEVTSPGDEEVNDSFSAEFEAEEVWLEMYEVAHLGFGRVSFTGVPCHNKGN